MAELNHERRLFEQDFDPDPDSADGTWLRNYDFIRRSSMGKFGFIVLCQTLLLIFLIIDSHKSNSIILNLQS